jgi:hypothetical protein
LTQSTTTLPASGPRSDSTVARWPSHGTAMMTTSAAALTSGLAPPSTAAVTPGMAEISFAAVSARSATREPISTRWPAHASR